MQQPQQSINDGPVRLATPVQPQDHVLGPAQAPITIVEYGDFECPHCKVAYPSVKLLVTTFGSAVRLAYRHFPLAEVHPHAELAAEASEAAGAQGKFWPMHDLLFENQQHLKASHLRGYAQRLELDLARYDYEMGDHVYLQRVREHIASGVASGVRGTPAFYVNGVYQDVSFGFEHLMEAVRRRVRVRAPRAPRRS